MATMTLQEVFDISARHLLTQMKKSEIHTHFGTSCAYRGPEGRMCAVGPLIKDEFFSESLNATTVLSSCVEEALLDSGVPKEVLTSGLLMNLQQVHDLHEPYDWKHYLKNVAKVYNLNTAVLEEF